MCHGGNLTRNKYISHMFQIFHGGEDMDLVAKHYFSRNITTRFFRVRPLTWSFDPSIRVEFYGCSGIHPYKCRSIDIENLVCNAYAGVLLV